MQFTLTIDLGNDAMQTYGDVRASLTRISWPSFADQLPEATDAGYIRDVNGNAVGQWQVTETAAEEVGESRNVPVIYELDGNGEATGTVHPFCSDACQMGSEDSIPKPWTAGVDSVSSFDEDTVCENCGERLPR